jgi:hypothetical protein
VEGLHSASDGTRAPARIVLPSHDRVAPPLRDPNIAPIFDKQLKAVIDAQVAAGEKIYTDYTLWQANNSDWEIIHKWISDKLFLGGIPAHYLIPDPALLPSKALRFFYIDNAWMDCFIDGALSVANHVEPVDDKVRRRIKDVYNVYLANNIEPLPVKPPVPQYGFILRSALIQVMPDIRITVTCRKGTAPNFVVDDSRQLLVRLTKMDDFTILALLDCLPEEIMSIVFIQPPHQQRYVAGITLTPPTFELRSLYTQNPPTSGVWPPLESSKQPTAVQMAKWYDAPSRCLDLLQMYSDFSPALATADFQSLIDSTVMALELNDASYQLTILPPTGSSPGTATPQNRQLWVGVDVNDPDDPIPPAQPVVVGPLPHDGQPEPPITVHPEPNTRREISPVLSVNLSAQAIPTEPAPPTHSSSSLATSTTPAPPLTPQFTLAIHPDYRGAAPLPYISTSGAKTYSSHDYIPTATTGLFDLIVSLSRLPSATSSLALVSLAVTIPLAGSKAPPSSSSPSSPPPIEPLLSTITGITAHMLSNKRLLPSLTTSTIATGTVGSGISITAPALTIALTPRAYSTASVPVADAADAGFRLTRARIAQVVAPRTVSVVGQETPVSRGVCTMRLVETYALAGGTTSEVVSEWDVVKRGGRCGWERCGGLMLYQTSHWRLRYYLFKR